MWLRKIFVIKRIFLCLFAGKKESKKVTKIPKYSKKIQLRNSQRCARVIFIDSESKALRVRVDPGSNKLFRVRVESWLGRV